MLRKTLPLLAFAGVIAASPAFAQTAYVGEIDTFAFNFCPVGWLPLNGQLVPINGNAALFSLIGIDYGGNGTTNFAVPVAKPVFTANGVQLTQCIATSGVFPSRN
jgi:microcystin-dependent protein